MIDPKPVAGFQWDSQQGVLIAYDAGGSASLAIPIKGLLALGFQARRFMAAEQAKLGREEAEKNQTGWLGISAPTTQTARVQTMQTLQGEHIVLIFDPNTETEFPMSFATRELALQVGEALVSAASAAPSAPTIQN